MYTSAERDALREELLTRAQADERIAAAAITGSLAADAVDEWSDLDLSFGVAEGLELEPVVEAWTDVLTQEHGAVHHWDVLAGPSIYRVFLLPNLLEIDLAFTPAAQFGSYGPNWKPVFGSFIEREPPTRYDERYTIGNIWHFVRHARAYIDRGKPWTALYCINEARDETVSLICARLGLPTLVFRGVELLPDEIKAALEPTIVRSLDEQELRRALAAVTDAFLAELREHDEELAARLEGPVGAFARSVT